MADYRESLNFEFAVAAQPSDLMQRLNEARPDIVHFPGHSGQVDLALEDAHGLTRIVSTGGADHFAQCQQPPNPARCVQLMRVGRPRCIGGPSPRRRNRHGPVDQ